MGPALVLASRIWTCSSKELDSFEEGNIGGTHSLSLLLSLIACHSMSSPQVSSLHLLRLAAKQMQTVPI